MRRLCVLFAGLCLLIAAATANAYGKTREDIYPQEIASETIRRKAEAFIDEAMRAAGDTRRYTVELVHVPRAIRTPEGEIDFMPSLPYGLRLWGNTAVYMDVLVNGAPFRRIKCQFKLHVFDKVAVAARPLTPNQPLTSADFRFEEQEIGARGQRFLTDARDIEGRVVSRPLSIGMPILRSMLKFPVIVEAGASVTLISRLNGIEVKTAGVALEPGREGAIIRVRNENSRKVLRGRVLDAFTVEIVQKR